ncbi:MAG: ComF family protein [Terriglobales bacterium]
MAADGLLSVLFPSHCRFCQAPLTRASRLPVCATCLEAIRPIGGPVCAACGERLFSPEWCVPSPEPSSEPRVASPENSSRTRGPVAIRSERDGALLCLQCMQKEPAFTRAAAYGSYDGGLRELIHLLKYDAVRPAANVLGRMLAEVIADIADAFGDRAPVILPVPLHQDKLRQRGFNQAELIARAALKLKPAALEVKLNTSTLTRHRATESQTGLTPQQRRENVRGAFRVAGCDEIAGRDILLIDDVFTTGTTASECARVLRRAGAERVWVATVARVLKPEAERAQPEIEEERAMAAHV